MKTPTFGIGEIRGVREYIAKALPALCARLGLGQDESTELLALAMDALESAVPVMESSLNAGMVEPTVASRRFWNACCDTFVSQDSTFFGAENLTTALAAAERGDNILVVQNHRSGADTMVMEALVNRWAGRDCTASWAYMSGHAVNLFLVPLLFTLAVRRFQIFSAKFRSMGLAGNTENGMAMQNMRAMRALYEYCRVGGRVVTLYPEGGRGEGGMKRGEPQTVCIPRIMSTSGPGKLIILPTYVEGSTSILPVHRGENEYNEVFVNARSGRASFTVGAPILWDDIQPHPDSVECLLPQFLGEGTTVKAARETASRRLMVDTLLQRVADLATNVREKGAYA